MDQFNNEANKHAKKTTTKTVGLVMLTNFDEASKSEVPYFGSYRVLIREEHGTPLNLYLFKFLCQRQMEVLIQIMMLGN